MTETQRFMDEDVVARRYSYADGDVLAFDLGAGVDGAVDVVDGTLMVVVDDEQYERELPAGTGAQATINNGVVTVEIRGDDAESTTDEVTDDADGTPDTEADR
jgi:hypothetical protein